MRANRRFIAVFSSAGNVSNVPLEIYRASVEPGWIDYNDHMNEGYYAVVFGNASDAYLTHAGFDDGYRQNVGGTFYTVETHIRYRRELTLGDPLLVRTTVLGVEARKLHLFHSLSHESGGYEAATQEVFMLHVALEGNGVTAMSDELLESIERDRAAHANHVPDGLGRSINRIGVSS